MPGRPGIEQILAERSAGRRLSLSQQEVLSPLVEGGVGGGGCLRDDHEEQ